MILPLLEHLASEGLDPKRILQRAGVPEGALADPKTRLPKRTFQALWQAASEATDDPLIALRVATKVKPNALGIISHLASASDSPRNAFELVKGVTPLLWEDFDCALENEGEAAFLRCHARGSAQARRFTTQYAIGLAVTMSRAFGTARSDPLEARFSHPPPAYAPEYERILRLPVRFDAAQDGVLFPIAMWDSTNPAADATLRDRKSTRLNSSHLKLSRMPSSA